MIFLADHLNYVPGAGTYPVLPEESTGGAFQRSAVGVQSAVFLKARKGIYIIDAPDCSGDYSMIMIFSRNIITPCSVS